LVAGAARGKGRVLPFLPDFYSAFRTFLQLFVVVGKDKNRPSWFESSHGVVNWKSGEGKGGDMHEMFPIVISIV
jgi:hypothetical protein